MEKAAPAAAAAASSKNDDDDDFQQFENCEDDPTLSLSPPYAAPAAVPPLAAAAALGPPAPRNGGIPRAEEVDAKPAAAAAAAQPHEQPPHPQGSRKLLSKWVQRLFDPDRPKGVMEPPQIMPLQDDLLQDFGKRAKEHQGGVTLQIDPRIEDSDDDHDKSPEGEGEEKKVMEDSETATTGNRDYSKTQEEEEKRKKVKITNLKYITTTETLNAICSQFGPVEQTNIIMDKKNTNTDDQQRSKGVAYVTFENPTDAVTCKASLSHVDARKVNVTWATTSNPNAPPRSTSHGGGGSGGGKRYWNKEERDLSTKCYHCGEIGHIANNCTNKKEVKPCPLCAHTDHEMRTCPYKTVCFNCGIPGHVNRECQQQQPMPTMPGQRRSLNLQQFRQVCTVCYELHSHRRAQCRKNNQSAYARIVAQQVSNAAQDAICLTCGNTGHYLCRELQWVSEMHGVSCCNCGMAGHIAYHCDRPILDVCTRDDNLVWTELERASTVSSVEEGMLQMSRQQRQQEEEQYRQQQQPQQPRFQELPADGQAPSRRDRGRQRGNQVPEKRRQFRSMPPMMPGRSRSDGAQRNNSNSNNNSQNNNLKRAQSDPPRMQGSGGSSPGSKKNNKKSSPPKWESSGGSSPGSKRNIKKSSSGGTSPGSNRNNKKSPPPPGNKRNTKKPPPPKRKNSGGSSPGKNRNTKKSSPPKRQNSGGNSNNGNRKRRRKNSNGGN